MTSHRPASIGELPAIHPGWVNRTIAICLAAAVIVIAPRTTMASPSAKGKAASSAPPASSARGKPAARASAPGKSGGAKGGGPSGAAKDASDDDDDDDDDDDEDEDKAQKDKGGQKDKGNGREENGKGRDDAGAKSGNRAGAKSGNRAGAKSDDSKSSETKSDDSKSGETSEGSGRDPHCKLSDEDCPSDEDDKSLTLGAEADQNARYIWRGLALSRGPVFQPSAWGSFYGLTADVAMNVMLFPGEATRESLSEVLPELSYELSWKNFRFEPGALVYWERGEDKLSSTAEAALKISYELGWFGLVTTHHFDVVSTPGAYFGTVGPQFKDSFGSATLRAVVGVGWASAAFNRAYLEMNRGALNIVEGQIEFRNKLSSLFYYSLHGETSALLVRSGRRDRNDPILFNAGLTLGTELSL